MAVEKEEKCPDLVVIRGESVELKDSISLEMSVFSPLSCSHHFKDCHHGREFWRSLPSAEVEFVVFTQFKNLVVIVAVVEEDEKCPAPVVLRESIDSVDCEDWILSEMLVFSSLFCSHQGILKDCHHEREFWRSLPSVEVEFVAFISSLFKRVVVVVAVAEDDEKCPAPVVLRESVDSVDFVDSISSEMSVFSLLSSVVAMVENLEVIFL